MRRDELAVEVLTIRGWYQGYIILPSQGRLLDFLNAKPEMIALTGVRDPSGAHHSFVAMNTAQVLAIRPTVQD